MHPLSTDWTERSQQLLVAAQTGDPAAMGDLLSLYRDYLLSIASQEIPAELHAKVNPSDVVQDTFLEASRIFARFRGTETENVRAWLRGILLNKLNELQQHYFGTEKRQIRREQSLDGGRNGPRLPQAVVGSDSTPSGHAIRNEESQQLSEALARLPEHYRQVLAWRSFEGLSFAEIGRRLERSEDAARMLYTRAFERLQVEMGLDDAAPGTDGTD